MQKTNNFSEIKSAGAVAQAAALTNLGLGGFHLDTGTANNIVVTIPGLTALTPGLPILISVAHPNTGPVTINVNGLGALPLIGGASTLQGGEIGLPGGLISVALNGGGTAFSLLGQTTGGPLQVAAGTQSNHAVNLGQFVGNASQNGYTKLPNGLIIQWGISNNASINPNTITLPITFPTAGLVVIASDVSASYTGTPSVVICSARFLSASQIQTATAYTVLTGLNLNGYVAVIFTQAAH